MAATRMLGVGDEKSLASLNNFSGARRRFEYKGETKNGVLVYDDYGHHPTEIKATLNGAREFFGEKKFGASFSLISSRTKALLNEFGKSFGEADEVILADIYAAREPKDESINSKDWRKK